MKLNKDKALNSIAIIMLLFTALIEWNTYSWLMLVAIIFILAAWYFKK
jgi:hypothetical protein